MEPSSTLEPAEPAQFPCGSYTISSTGNILVSALPSTFPRVVMEVIAKVVLSAFNMAQDLESPLTEIAADFAGLEIRAQYMDGGAIIFVTPQEY